MVTNGVTDDGVSWESRRYEVLERDGFSCQYCGSDQSLRAHHIHRDDAGGADSIDNLVTLCKPHHHASHIFGEGETIPVEVLSENGVPKQMPQIRGLRRVPEVMVLDMMIDGKDSSKPWGMATPDMVKCQLGVSQQVASRALQSLLDAGWVEAVGTGVYRFVDDPREND